MITTEGKTPTAVVIEILNAIIRQGGQCLSAKGGCAYTGTTPSEHCAIGHLMPDNGDFLTFAGSVDFVIESAGSLDDELVTAFGENGNFVLENKKLMHEMQSFHDADVCMLDHARIHLTNHLINRQIVAYGSPEYAQLRELFRQWEIVRLAADNTSDEL